MGNPAVCLKSSQSCWDCSWTGSSWLSFQPTVTHKQASSWAPIIFENPTMETGCDQWGRCQRQCASSQVYWSAEEYRQTFVSCIMSAGQLGFSLVWEGAEDGRWGGGRVGWRWVGGRGGGEGVAAAVGASGVQRQEEEVTVCWAPWPLGRGSGPALTPSLPAHGSRVTSHPSSPSHHHFCN